MRKKLKQLQPLLLPLLRTPKKNNSIAQQSHKMPELFCKFGHFSLIRTLRIALIQSIQDCPDDPSHGLIHARSLQWSEHKGCSGVEKVRELII
jgi:hypothetical protein